MNNRKYVYLFVSLATITTLAGAIPAFAQATPLTQPNNGVWNGRMNGGLGGSRGMMKPGVFGTVSAVNGNTLTVAGKQGFGANAVSTTYTVDATNAKVMKNNVAGTVSSIAVGDTIMAQGTLTGTNLVATNIRDGVLKMGTRGGPNNTNKSGQTASSPITGNGQPVVAGAVVSVNGNTLNITNKSNVSYVVDTTNAKIVQGSNTVTISNVAVGDMVIVQGTVSGNSVVATSVIDQTKLASTATTAAGTTTAHKGFFAGIGSFFAHIFGF